MPSNEKLIESIETEAKAKGVDVPVTEGKNNADLIAILKELKTPTPPAPAKDDDDPDAEAAAAAKAEAAAAAKAEADALDKVEAPVKRPPFYIKDGKAITTKRGILADGDEITAKDLAGGKDAINKFIKTGHIGKG